MADTITAMILHRIQEIERRDDNQILASLAGEAIKEYAYRFNDSKGRLITGLSWTGIKEIAAQRGNIIVQDADISESDDYIRVVIKATDLNRNVSVFGGCHQPKKMRVNVGQGQYEFVPDEFYFQKALSKAQRNAIKSLLPTTLLTKMLQAYLGKKPLPREKGKAQPQATSPAHEVKDEELKTYNDVMRICFELYKLQPADVLRELGVGSQMDLTITPLEAFQTIRALYEDIEKGDQ